jgi:protein TonB
MTEQNLPYSSLESATNQSFLLALLIAVIVHVMFVLGVQVPKPEARQFIKDIDVTIIDTPSIKAPEKSEFLAQDNQLGQSQQISKPVPAKQDIAPQKPSPQIKPVPKTPVEKAKPKYETKPIIKTPPEKAKPVLQEKRIIKTPPEQIKTKPQTKPVIKTPKPIKPVQAQPVIAAPEKIAPILPQQTVPKDLFQADKPKETEKEPESVKEETEDQHETEFKSSSSSQEKHRPLSMAALQQQISEQAIATTHRPASAMQTKTKSVNQVSANKSVAAQYKRDWESKVERIGNLNYPEAASKPGFSATLTMDVGIKADGSIDSIRITQSSGIPELDEAAIKIVRMCAPFPPLPAALQRELDILLITRVWKFTDESGLITQ